MDAVEIADKSEDFATVPIWRQYSVEGGECVFFLAFKTRSAKIPPD